MMCVLRDHHFLIQEVVEETILSALGSVLSRRSAPEIDICRERERGRERDRVGDIDTSFHRQKKIHSPAPNQLEAS